MHPRVASLGILLALRCSLGCGDRSAVPRDAAMPRADLASDSGVAEAQVTVINGFGSGHHPVGAEIDVFADAPPETRTCSGWTGDVGELAEPGEWHTTLRVPARDVTVTATFLPSEAAPTARTYLGANT